MKILAPLLEKPLRAAVLAALSFGLGVLCASVSSLGFDPSQHPLGLLPSLPGLEGEVYRALLFLFPFLMTLVALGAQQRLWQHTRTGRLSVMLLVLALVGHLGMGLLPMTLEDLSGQGARWHAASWLLWLAAGLAGMTALATVIWRQGRCWTATGLLVAAWLTASLSGGWLTVVSGPASQLMAWGIWFASWMGLAEMKHELAKWE